MQTTVQRCTRILGALEDLVAQEGAALRSGDFAAATELSDRAAPLVEFLVLHGAVYADTPDLRERLTALHARREANVEWLGAEIARVRDELQQTHVAKRRVAQVAPVYGKPAAPRSRLQAMG